MSKRVGEVNIPVWEEEDPYFDVVSARLRSKGGAQVGVFKPRRVIDNANFSVHSGPSSSDVVLGVYENAVMISGLRGAVGLFPLMLFGLISSLCLVALAIYGYSMVWSFGFQSAAISVPTLLISLGCNVFGVCAFSVIFRVMFLMPSDFPVVFNRKTREVWVSVPKMPSFRNIFEIAPVRFELHSWDDLKPRVYRIMEVTPGVSSARWIHALTLVFERKDAPRQVACEINIGSRGWGDDFEQLQLWEHIRLYMVEGRPGLDVGEKYKKIPKGKLPVFPPEALESMGRCLSEEEASAR